MTFRIIADENIPVDVVYKLRENNIDVISITESYKGIKDTEIIKVAQKKNSIILTFDKDFGELTYKADLKAEGVILLRITPKSIEYIFKKTIDTLNFLKLNPGRYFIVVGDDKLRIRDLKL